MQPTSVSHGPPMPPEGPAWGWQGQWQLLGGGIQVGPSLEVLTAWSLSTGISSLPPALSLPLAMSLVPWQLVPQPQTLEDKMGMRSLHHHHYTHTHTLTHPNQLEARGMGRVQKEVSKEGQEGVREKSLQCGARWGENGKGQGALRVQGVGGKERRA